MGAQIIMICASPSATAFVRNLRQIGYARLSVTAAAARPNA